MDVEITGISGGSEGFFYRGPRFVAKLALRVNGKRPSLLNAGCAVGNGMGDPPRENPHREQLPHLRGEQMIEVMRDLPEHVLGFTARGTVTDADYRSVLIPELEARFQSHARLSLLYHFAGDFSRFEAEAIWDDTWADLRHFRAWEKIAVVADSDWIRKAASLFGVLRPGRVRVFTGAQFEEAREWVATRTAA